MDKVKVVKGSDMSDEDELAESDLEFGEVYITAAGRHSRFLLWRDTPRPTMEQFIAQMEEETGEAVVMVKDVATGAVLYERKLS